MPCCPPPSCCPAVVIKTRRPRQQSQCVQVQVPSMTTCCEIPPPPMPRQTTNVCIPVTICEEDACGSSCPPKKCGPLVISGNRCCPPKCGPPSCCPPSCCQPSCCESSCCPTSCCQPSCCPPPINLCSVNCPPKNNGCGKIVRREKRWPMCNFMKPCIDTRIYRDGEAMVISYAGHIPGEQFIHGRNLPTTTTFAKRRLCQYTPYEFIDPDGCCTFPCTFPCCPCPCMPNPCPGCC